MCGSGGWVRTGMLALAVSMLGGCGSGSGERSEPTAAAEIPKEAAPAPGAPTAAARGASTPAGTAPGAEPHATANGTARPQATVVAYLKASADGDPRACRLFTERGLRRFLRDFAPNDPAGALDACEALFELAGQDGNRTVEVGGRELTADQVGDVRLEVEHRPGSRSARVSGPGAHARLVLVDGKWLIDSVEEAG